jgi:hypothetical protein
MRRPILAMVVLIVSTFGCSGRPQTTSTTAQDTSGGAGAAPAVGPAWARIVADHVDDEASKWCADIAPLTDQGVLMTGDGTNIASAGGVASEVLVLIDAAGITAMSIDDIDDRYGPAEKLTTTGVALKSGGPSVDFTFHAYGPIALGVQKGEDAVTWLAAPKELWVAGLRARAEKELQAQP